MPRYLSRKGESGYYVPSGNEPYTYLKSLLSSSYPLAQRIGHLAEARIRALESNIQIHGLTGNQDPTTSHQNALSFLKDVAIAQRQHEIAYINARIKDIESLGEVGTEEQKLIDAFRTMLNSDSFDYKIFINTLNSVITNLQKHIKRVNSLLDKTIKSTPQVNLIENLEAMLDDYSQQRQQFVLAQEEIIRQLTMKFFSVGDGQNFIQSQAQQGIQGAVNTAAATALVQQMLAQYIYDNQLLTYYKNGNKNIYTYNDFIEIINKLNSSNVLEKFMEESNITSIFHNEQLLKDTAALYGIEVVNSGKNRNSKQARASQKLLRKIQKDLSNDPFINNTKFKKLCSQIRVTWKPGNRGISLHNELLGGLKKGVTHSIHLGTLNIGTDALLAYSNDDSIQNALQDIKTSLNNSSDIHDAQEISQIYIKQLQDLDKRLEKIQKSFILHETTKMYTTLESEGKFSHRKAFEGRTMNIKHYINSISQMYAQFVDTRWLEFALYNLATDALGSILLNPVQSYLAIYGGMVMFDDFAIIGREITKKMTFSNIENLHLYRLQDIYVPASVFLDATYKALVNETDTLLNNNEFSIEIEGIPTIDYYNKLGTYKNKFEERWSEVKEESDNIKVKLMFGANFLQFMKNLV